MNTGRHTPGRRFSPALVYAKGMRLEVDEAQRLDRFLAIRLPEYSRTKLAVLIQSGAVRVDGLERKPGFQLVPGMAIELEPPRPSPPHDLTPADIPLNVPYEDDDLLVVDKPRGLATHPAASLKEPSLVNALLARNHSLSGIGGDFRPGIVHRLDKDTTGLLIVAKNDAAHRALARQIERKETERRYVAVVAGRVELDRMIIRAPIAREKKNRLRMAVAPDGKPATTHVHRLRLLAEGSLLSLRLETGRTHQIRVHLSSVGHPVLGDRLYAPRSLAERPLQLHAVLLSFAHPRTGARIEVFAPPPKDFLAWDQVTQDVL